MKPRPRARPTRPALWPARARVHWRQRPRSLPAAARLVVFALPALLWFAAVAELAAQPWTSPTAPWGSVSISVGGGANAEDFLVRAVEHGEQLTIFHILVPHQFLHGQDPAELDYLIDIANQPDSANQQEPLLRHGNNSAPMPVATRKFTVERMIESEGGVAVEEEDEHNVQFVVFTPACSSAPTRAPPTPPPARRSTGRRTRISTMSGSPRCRSNPSSHRCRRSTAAIPTSS